MSKSISFPKVIKSRLDSSLTILRKLIIDEGGKNIILTPDKLTEIKRKFVNASADFQSDCFRVNFSDDGVSLNGERRYFLKSIDYQWGDFILNVMDCLEIKEYKFNFVRDITNVYSERYKHQNSQKHKKKKSNHLTKKNSHISKSDSDKEIKHKEYCTLHYRIVSKKESYDDIMKDVVAYNKKWDSNSFYKVLSENGYQITNNDTHCAMSPKEEPVSYNFNILKRLVPFLNDIRNETTLNMVISDLIRCGELKKYCDSNEKMKLTKEIEERKEVLSLFA